MSRHINIQFYLQRLLFSVSQRVISDYKFHNLYAVLANELQKTYERNNNKMQYGIVSFNQDTIFEHFLYEYFKISFSSMDDYVNVKENPFVFFKPHGSWNWGWEFPENDEGNHVDMYKLYNENTDFYDLYFKHLGSTDDMVDWTSFGINKALDNKGKLSINKSKITLVPFNNLLKYYPALLLPYRDKDEFTMPHSHLETLNSYLTNIEDIYIIGWKGNEEYFNNLLISRARKIKKIVIADPSPESIEINLINKIPNNKNIQIVKYGSFEELVKNFSDQISSS